MIAEILGTVSLWFSTATNAVMAYKCLFSFGTHAAGGIERVLFTNSRLLPYHTPLHLRLSGWIYGRYHQVQSGKITNILSVIIKCCCIKGVGGDPYRSIHIGINSDLQWHINNSFHNRMIKTANSTLQWVLRRQLIENYRSNTTLAIMLIKERFWNSKSKYRGCRDWQG